MAFAMSATHELTTAQQLLDAPAPGRCELLQGELVMMTPAGYEHARLVSRIDTRLAFFVERHALGEVLSGEGGFQIGWNPDTVRAPDVAFIGSQRIPRNRTPGFFQGAPDLAVEVVSPGDRAAEVVAKARMWLDAGCRAVWVVDPGTQSIAVYRTCQEAEVLRRGDKLHGGEVLPGFTIPVAELFGG